MEVRQIEPIERTYFGRDAKSGGRRALATSIKLAQRSCPCSLLRFAQVLPSPYTRILGKVPRSRGRRGKGILPEAHCSSLLPSFDTFRLHSKAIPFFHVDLFARIMSMPTTSLFFALSFQVTFSGVCFISRHVFHFHLTIRLPTLAEPLPCTSRSYLPQCQQWSSLLRFGRFPLLSTLFGIHVAL